MTTSDHSVPTLLVNAERAAALKQASLHFPSLTLTKRQLCDLELLLNGGYYPLTGFMDTATYTSVLERCQLPDGQVWPMPIVLDVTAPFAEQLQIGQQIALRDTEGFMPAVLTVTAMWAADKTAEAIAVFGTDSPQHIGVRSLTQHIQSHYIGGTVAGLQLPPHYEFEQLWHTPTELRTLFAKRGWREVLAVHGSKPLHHIHRRVFIDAAQREQLPLLIHPAAGETEYTDMPHIARIQCYQALLPYFPANMTEFALLPLARRLAGPREALWHALVHRNYGCSHFLIGSDHASPPVRMGQPRFYQRYAAQEFAQQYADTIGIHIVTQPEYHYVPQRATFLPEPDIERAALETAIITDDEIKHRLQHDLPIPEWVTAPEVLTRLRKVYPPRSQQGITIFFTGLSGSGKSTLANILMAKLLEIGERPVSLLDGDIVRQHLSSELGFSKAHRDLNIRRIGFVASEITKNGGVAICAPIAPYQATRHAVREGIEQYGAFIEIHVATPLEICEARDRKGLYAKARQGLIPEFTGISDPYEIPVHPELRLDTSQLSPTEAVQQIVLYLFKAGLLH